MIKPRIRKMTEYRGWIAVLKLRYNSLTVVTFLGSGDTPQAAYACLLRRMTP